MKRTSLFKSLALGALMISVIASCTEQFTGQDALQLQSNFDRNQALLEDSLRRVAAETDFERQRLLDSLLRTGGRINYAVTVISGANSGTRAGRGEIASGATVTVSQHGQTSTATTDASGQVVFDNMRVGNASVTVTAADHTSAAIIVDLTPVEAVDGDATIDYSKVTRNAATIVPLFPTAGSGTATIQGQILGQTDFTNEDQENIQGYAVTAYIEVDNLDGDYFNPNGATNADAAGRIIQITYTDVAQTVTSGADGTYSMVVPASGDGLPIEIVVSDFATDVTYFSIGENSGNAIVETTTKSHVFSPGQAPSVIDQIPGAFVRIDAPTGSEETGSGANASAIVEDEGVLVALRIGNVGRGYTQAPEVEITGEGFGAAGNVSITSGRITDATLTSGGQDYDELSTNVNLVFGGKKAEVSPNVEFSLNDMMGEGWSIRDDVNYGNVSGAGGYNDIVTNTGDGYITQPGSFAVANDNGTGATVTALAMISVDQINETAKGAGYTATPLATFSGGTIFDEENPSPAHAGVILAAGPIVSATLDNSYEYGKGPFSNDKSADPSVTIDDVNGNSYNVSSAADIDVTWSSTGVLPKGTTLQINNAGSGYINGEVDLTFGGAGASTEAVQYKVSTNGDAITQVEILNTTDGWDQEQTITITATGLGSGADLQLPANVIEYRVASITINTGGSYRFNTLTQDEIDENQDGVNPYGGGIFDNDMRLYVNSSNDDFLYDTDITFNRCVESISLINAGQYLEGPTALNIGAAPSGGEDATATIDLDGFIYDLIINGGGSGYIPEGTAITITGSTKSNDAEVNMEPFESNLNSWEELAVDPVLVGFTVDKGGSGYSAAPNVRVTVPGGAGNSYGVAQATISGDAVSAVNFVSGLTSVEYNFSDLTDLDWSGISVDVNIWKDNGDVKPVFATGSVVAVNVTNGGEGYDAADPPTVRFVTGGGNTGSGAEGVAVVIDGRVVRVDVTNGGSGYDPANAPSVEFIEPDATPVTAAAIALIDEKTGAISRIQLRSPTADCFNPNYYASGFGSPSTSGEGYEAVPTATVEPSVAGLGSGAILEVEINDEGEVTSITVVNGGSGYLGRNYSVNFNSIPGNNLQENFVTSAYQSNGNTFSGKTHIRNINIGSGRTPDGN